MALAILLLNAYAAKIIPHKSLYQLPILSVDCH
jgi:hypothetical protein